MEHQAPPYGAKIKQLSIAFERAFNDSLAQTGLTYAQGKLLSYLGHHTDGPVYAKDLEQHFHLTHPTVSGLLQRLEAKGFLAVRQENHDRRCKRLELTPQALENQARLRAMGDALNQLLVKGFTAREQEQFWQLLSRAVENVETNPCKKQQEMEETL